LGYGTALATILAVFDYSGGTLWGNYAHDGSDEVSRKEFIRKNRRRPVEETVLQLGEGRGEFLPLYCHLYSDDVVVYLYLGWRVIMRPRPSCGFC